MITYSTTYFLKVGAPVLLKVTAKVFFRDKLLKLRFPDHFSKAKKYERNREIGVPSLIHLELLHIVPLHIIWKWEPPSKIIKETRTKLAVFLSVY